MRELTGKLSNNVRFTEEGKAVITFELNERMAALEMVDELYGKEKLSIKVGKATTKRSTDANSYYWSLVGKLSKALKISRPYCHNLMLRRYGTFEDFGGQVAYSVLPDTDEANKKADESEKFHIKPTSQVREGKDGVMYRTYILLKGSHSYTKEEFGNLLDGVISEAKELGIPTETPEQIARMKDLWGA